MTKEEILDWYCHQSDIPIYAWMYGTHTKAKSIEEDLVKIYNYELKLSMDRTEFIYVWGWPGPDYNVYKLDDYGKTFSFDKNDFYSLDFN